MRDLELEHRPIVYLSPEALRPHEEYSPERAVEIVRLIETAGAWTHPLAVERDSHCIMDGHHRLHAARLLRLWRIPCLLYTYDEVAVHTRRPAFAVTPAGILARCRAGDLFPPKTTWHRFPAVTQCHIPLSALGYPSPCV